MKQELLWPKWLQQKDRLRGLSAVPRYSIDFKRLHAFRKPVLVVTGTNTIEPNKIIDKLLSIEFLHAKTASLQGGTHSDIPKSRSFCPAIESIFARD
jgi:hypothetical protein